MSLWLGLALAVTPTAPPPPQHGVAWFRGDLDQAMAAARAERKIVVLDAWATWCKFCHEMDRNVWGRDDVARMVAQQAIAIHPEVDVMSGVGGELAARYQIESLPVTLFLDPRDGAVLTQLLGYQSAETVLASLDRAYGKVSAALAALPAADTLIGKVAEGGRLLRSQKPDQAERLATEVLTRDQDCKQDAADDAALLLADVCLRRNDPQGALSALLPQRASCARASAARELWERLLSLAAALQPDRLDSLLDERAELFPADQEAQRVAAVRRLTRGDIDGAAALQARLSKLAPDDPGTLALAARVELARGETAKARDLVDRAIKIDPQDPELRELRLQIHLRERGNGS